MPLTTRRIALFFCFALSLALLSNLAQAQTYSILYTFSGGAAGNEPVGGLTIDHAGNLYGTTFYGASDNCVYGCGTAFKLSHEAAGWTLDILHTFLGGPDDGAGPISGLTFGPDGALYGTTTAGGQGNGQNCRGCGTVFRMTPPPTLCRTPLCPWIETVLYNFQGGPTDGQAPNYGSVIFDRAGNLYGGTIYGGNGGPVLCGSLGSCGIAYELSPDSGGWQESVITRFGGSLGYQPYSGLILDNAGDLYGTTTTGPSTVYELTQNGSGWSVHVLYTFSNAPRDGSQVEGNLLFDQAGNLYGTTTTGGPNGGGTVFELSPSAGNWTLTTLYSFTGSSGSVGPTNLTMDAVGNLYGTTFAGEGLYGDGNVFKLSPSSGGWIYTSLHDFTGLNGDGYYPLGQTVLDSSGNLYGTTIGGGANCTVPSEDCGVVWEVAGATGELQH